ncbi:type II toxin-antitoxin system RelE/ParE family toxin [Variovorax guangxiensis]|uniref:type II toxin-antitoxin system RelE/ParE family toxin n=1 Tax=Variovorax guangxiensis TaxID=1775474 RepID=UPI002859435A|nr:type II toxin-antitoxin system RelE/ParE family toxin [Variovorax guangxiensis]MDR6853891.1 putative addiction module killer protein [Variovorax guangxiensis]
MFSVHRLQAARRALRIEFPGLDLARRIDPGRRVTYTLPSMPTIRVEEYVREDGSSPYKNWFDDLAPQAAAKITTAKLRLELGNVSSVKWFDGMGEYVIDWGPGYRIYLAKDGDMLIVLFGGGTKRGQQRDIDQAKTLLAEYKARKRARHQAAKVGSGQQRK